MKFYGYRRPDGKFGVRNHVLIMPSVGCANETARIIAGLVTGAVSMVNQHGCGETIGNRKITQLVLAGLAANPNVYGVVLVGLGCEPNTADEMAQVIAARTNKPVRTLEIQAEGGTLNTINKAVRYAQELVVEASAVQREECNISELMLGIECGSSDATSGLVSNPVMGNVSDRLVDLGAVAMFSETPEIIGAEHILARRCATPEMGKKLLAMCNKTEEDMRRVGENLRSGQPGPGNKAGGISTLEEKSLGCIHKGGTKIISEVLDYACAPTKKGLIYMDTPGYDMLSVTAKVAAGCQVIVFTTGRGNPIGNPVAPVLKVTANKDLFARMHDNLDMDFSAVFDGKGMEEMGLEVLQEVLRVANGKLTKAEAYGFGFTETIMRRLCDYC